MTTYIVNSADHSPGTASLHRLRAAPVPYIRRATAAPGRARLGRTWARMIDQVYVELYEEAGREMADAIDALVRERLAERPVAES